MGLEEATSDRVTLSRLTPRAKADLRSIWSYIAADGIEAADRVEEAIHDACVFLATSPLNGHLNQVASSILDRASLSQIRDCL